MLRVGTTLHDAVHAVGALRVARLTSGWSIVRNKSAGYEIVESGFVNKLKAQVKLEQMSRDLFDSIEK